MVDIARIRQKALQEKSLEKNPRRHKQTRIQKSSPKSKESEHKELLLNNSKPSEIPEEPTTTSSTPTRQESIIPPDVAPSIEKSVLESNPLPLQSEKVPQPGFSLGMGLTTEKILERLFTGTRSWDVIDIDKAVSPTHVAPIKGGKSLVIFSLNNEWYAFTLEALREILRFRPYTRIPNSPEDILGVMNMRGNMIVVVNSYNRLGLNSPSLWTRKHRIAILNVDGDLLGLIVENVAHVAHIGDEELQLPPIHLPIKKAAFVKHIFIYQDQVVSYLDLQQFFDFEPKATES